MNLSEQQQSALRWAYCLTSPNDLGGYPGGQWRSVPSEWCGRPRTVSSLVDAQLLERVRGSGGENIYVRITKEGAALRRSFQ